jgi:hypothetical protein
MKILALSLGTVLFWCSLFAHSTVINFDDPGLTPLNAVDAFYSAEGVIFETNTWWVLGGLGETSAPYMAYSGNETGYMNVLGGFTDVLAFSYGAISDTTVNIFDGLNGTGTVIGSLDLPANNPFAFDHVSISFSGLAFSVAIVGTQSNFGWDDVQFSNNQREMPVTATIPLFGIGVAALMLCQRKRIAA